MNLLLTRYPSSEEGTWGTLTVPSSLTLFTLEEPWIANPYGPGGMRRSDVQHESCVPDGVYRLEPHNSEHHPDTWCLVNPLLGCFHEPSDAPALGQWGRIAILIHNGNTLVDTEGCILVGLHREQGSDGRFMVTESVAALQALRDAIGPGEHQLTIKWA